MQEVREKNGEVCLWDTTRGGQGQGGRELERSGRATIPGRAAGPRIGPRSQVEIHNAAQAASSKLCAVAAVRGAALWYAPREAAGPYRCAARRGLGSSSCSHSTGFFWFALGLCYLHAWHAHRSFGRGPPASPLTPALDLSMTRSSPPSFRPAADGQTGWSQARQTEVLLQPRCQLGPSACLMHDSVATASATRGSKTGPAPAGDGRAGSRKSGVPVVLHRSIYGLRLGRLWIGCYGARGIRKWGPTGR